jgi:predicted RNase H-like HicB family nuclease
MSLQIAYELDLATGLIIGSIPGIPGANTQGESMDEVCVNLCEVMDLLRAENTLEPKNVS